MISEKCVRAVISHRVGLGVEEMSTLSVRAPGLQATTMFDTRSLRVRGVTTLDNVRRNLFGCVVDREENRKFVERELARQTEIDNQKWGFDFTSEQPLPGSQRYAWHLVPASSVPSALRRATMISPKPKKPSQEAKVSSPECSKSQRRITDFLKPQKRLSNSGKKSPGGAHIRPPKVARLSQTHKRSS